MRSGPVPFCLCHCGIPWFFYCCFLFCTAVPLWSSGPTVALSVGHFNSDSIADTLVGQRSGSRSFLPKAIHWGTGGSTVLQTQFVLPAWSDISGSCAVTDLNDDDLLDIIFYLKGDSTGQPVARSLVITGGASLDQQATVSIASLASQQSTPFVTRDLVKGSELTDAKVRDLLGHNSYLLTVGFGSSLPSVLTGVQEQAPWTVSLYPNPTGRVVTLQGQALTPGEYRVHVLSLQGVSLYEQPLTVGSSGDFTGTLDLHELASGTYIVRLSGIHTNQHSTSSLVLIR